MEEMKKGDGEESGPYHPQAAPESDAAEDEACEVDASPRPEDEAWERRYRETQDFLHELEQDGWKRDAGGALCHPDDPEVSVWFEPYSGELFLSPKYIEGIKRMLRPNQEK